MAVSLASAEEVKKNYFVGIHVKSEVNYERIGSRKPAWVLRIVKGLDPLHTLWVADHCSQKSVQYLLISRAHARL